ncbi:uncharacterized protein LOC119686100 [Teleopsis dalmanni]|uniref:uncharacterized protein LOC119686100 n=1 Tax=Teleopsis dalmanni TaxID=139649 RepID=UPI000D32D2A6|nr:uncharacterized protein LOC119686100 [Teleopsis dalmanni]
MAKMMKLLFHFVSAFLVLNCVSARRISYELKGVHSPGRIYNRMTRAAGVVEHLANNGNGNGNIEFLGAAKSSPVELLGHSAPVEMLNDEYYYDGGNNYGDDDKL